MRSESGKSQNKTALETESKDPCLGAGIFYSRIGLDALAIYLTAMLQPIMGPSSLRQQVAEIPRDQRSGRGSLPSKQSVARVRVQVWGSSL